MIDPARFSDAVWRGDADAVRHMIAAGADVNVMPTDADWPPLHLAVEHLHREVVSVLLAAGAALEFDVDGTGATPLVHAIDIESDAAWQRFHEPDRASVEITGLLLRAGAKPIPAAFGIAKRYGNRKALALLHQFAGTPVAT